MGMGGLFMERRGQRLSSCSMNEKKSIAKLTPVPSLLKCEQGICETKSNQTKWHSCFGEKATIGSFIGAGLIA